MRSWLLTLLALAIGFAGGWLTRAILVPATSNFPALGPTTASEAPLRPAPSPATVPPATSAPKREPVDSAISLAVSRAALLRGLRQAGMSVHGPIFSAKGLTPNAASLLGLSSTEFESVNAAYLEAGRTIDDIRAKSVTAERSPDGNKLLVHVPAIDVATSRGIYDRFQNTLATTLGPERLALLSEVAGEQIPQSFQNFGLNDVSYDVNLQAQPRTILRNGRELPLINYERRFSDPTGSRGTSQSMGTFSDVNREDPLLAPFIPPELRVPAEP